MSEKLTNSKFLIENNEKYIALYLTYNGNHCINYVYVKKDNIKETNKKMVVYTVK